MKQKSFHALLMLAAMLSAVIMAGGCGGSHSEVGQALSDNAAPVIQDDEMSKVETEALNALAEEMLRDGTLFKIA